MVFYSVFDLQNNKMVFDGSNNNIKDFKKGKSLFVLLFFVIEYVLVYFIFVVYLQQNKNLSKDVDIYS